MNFLKLIGTRWHYWPATKKGNDQAYKFINEYITGTRHTQIITGERGLFKSEDFYKICLSSALTLCKPEIDVYSYIKITTENEESKETKNVKIAKKILSKIEDYDNRKIFLNAIQMNLLRIWQTNEPIEVPHNMLFDDKDVYFQRLHEVTPDDGPDSYKEAWFVENANYLRWKYLPKIKEIKNSATLINSAFRGI